MKNFLLEVLAAFCGFFIAQMIVRVW